MLVDLLRGARITILMYHAVSPRADAYAVSPDTFKRHARFIRDRYSVVSLQKIPQYLAGGHDRQVAFSFDDAFADFEEYAYPTLSELGVPATVFVPTGFIGRSNVWDRHAPDVSPRSIMSADQLRTLAADPLIDLGSHTVDHVSMRRLARREMHHQAVNSRRELEDLTGRPVTAFSYPFGQRDDFSPVTQAVLGEAGYEIAVTTCWGTRNSVRDLLCLRRIWLAESDDLQTVGSKIDGAYDWIAAKEQLAFTLRSWTGRLVIRPDHRSSLT
jgi:peptidoglycan/xylan/chitin deacetylase (PgdA/CDA1 family)